MKKFDNKTEVQPEEVKPEEVKVDKANPEAEKPKKAKTKKVEPEQTTPVEEVKPTPDTPPVEQPEQAEEAAPVEEPTEEKTKKSFFSSKRNIAIVACAGAAVVALSLGLGLGLGLKKDGKDDEGENPPPAKTALSVPVDVAVNGNIFSWSAVENAVQYTVKINDDETTTVSKTSFDLATAVSLLNEGENSLWVKANATDTYLASAYSSKVTYNYTKPSEEKTPFTAPTVTLDGNTLKWNAIDGATEYTVKINDDETTTVKGTSLDLTSVTAKLKEGENMLSVKANATSEHKESTYSETKSYIYKTPFASPVATLDGDTLKWNAVVGATEYTVKIGDDETTTVNTNSLDLTTVTEKLKEGENTLSVKVNAAGYKLDSEYSNEVKYNYVDEDKVAAAAFDKLIAELDITASNAAEKLSAAKAAYSALSDRAKELAATSYAKLKEEDGKYFVALVNNIGEVTEDSGEVIETAVNHYATLLDNTAANVVAAKATLDEKNSAYKNFYTSYVEAFDELVKAIVIVDNSRGDVIDTAKSAIDEADEYYNAQTSGVKSALAELKLTLDGKRATYTTAVKAELDGYETLIDEALEIIEAASDLKALTDKKTEITAYELSAVNQAAVDADDIAAIDTAISNWNTAISAAVAELTVIATDDDEADIVSAQTAIAKYDNYAVYIKENASVKAAKTATEGVLATAKSNIENDINAIKTATEAAIENATPSETNYAALEAQKEAIENVNGAYASEYLATLKIGEDNLITAVEKAMATMLATSVREEGGEAYSLDGEALKITLFKTFYNFRDEKLVATDGANKPELTIECNGMYDGKATVVAEQQFTKNDVDEYVAVVYISNLGAMGENPAYVVTVGGNVKRTPIEFGEALVDNPYFTNDNEVVEGTPTGFKKAFNEYGNFVMNFQANCTAQIYYLAVYNANAIEVDGGFANFSEMPLGTINLAHIKETLVDENKPVTREILNRLVANELDKKVIGKTVSLRFMIYGETVTDGVSAFTAMNPSVISEAIEFNLVEEDKYYTLPEANLWGTIETVVDKDVIYLVNENFKSDIINFVNDSLTDAGVNDFTPLDADNYKDYLQLKIELYDASDDAHPVLYTKYTDNIAFQGITVEGIVEQWQKEYFTEHGYVADVNHTIAIRFAYIVNPDTAIAQYFPRTTFVETTITRTPEEDPIKYVEDIVLSKYSYVLPNTGMGINEAKDAFEFLRGEKGADGYVGNGKILSQGDALYLEIKFYLADGENETNVNYAYLYKEGNDAVLYKYLKEEGTEENPHVTLEGNVGNSYVMFNNINFVNFLKNYEVNGYPMRWDDGWTFTARYVINPASENYLFSSEWSTPITIDSKSITMTKTPQITFDGANFVFFSAFGEGADQIERSAIFTDGAVDKVEFRFYQGETEGTNYCINVTYNKETGKIEFSYTTEEGEVKLTNTITGDSIENGWSNTVAMANIVNEYLTAITPEGTPDDEKVTFTGEWNIYTVTHLRNGSKILTGGDENGNVKSDEYAYTV